MHQAIAVAIASEFCGKCPFARNFRGENELFASSESFAKPFAIASEVIRSAYFAAFFSGIWSLANVQGASFAFVFAAVSLRPRCTQLQSPSTAPEHWFLKFRRVTIRGAQPSTRLSEEICLSEALGGSLRGLCGVSPRVLQGLCGVHCWGPWALLSMAAGITTLFKEFDIIAAPREKSRQMSLTLS